MSAGDVFTLLSLEKTYTTRGFSLSLINWMASSTPLTVMMGSSGPKISSFITLDSPVTSFSTVGAARRQQEEGLFSQILLCIQRKNEAHVVLSNLMMWHVSPGNVL